MPAQHKIEANNGGRTIFIYKSRRIGMSDDKSKAGAPDRDRINVNEDYELRGWSKKLGVTPEQLKKAVQSVGTSADSVRKHLGK
jgi:Protein of unknown function (DUF3606)